MIWRVLDICDKFDPTNKRCVHNQAPVLENETHKLIWDFDIKTAHLISAEDQILE